MTLFRLLPPSSLVRLVLLSGFALFVFAACDSGSNLVDSTPDDAPPTDDPAVTSTIHETTIDGVRYQTEIQASNPGVGGAEKYVHRIDHVPQPTSTTYKQQTSLTWSFTASGTLSVEAGLEAAGVGGFTIGGSTSYSRTFTASEMQSSAIQIDLDTGEAADVFASTTGRYYNVRQRTCNLFGCSAWEDGTFYVPEGVQLRYEVEALPACKEVSFLGVCNNYTYRWYYRSNDIQVLDDPQNAPCGPSQKDLWVDGVNQTAGSGSGMRAGSITISDADPGQCA